jgi:hypothetical protein
VTVMLKRIWAVLTRRRLVWLRDMDGDVTLTFAERDAFGYLTAQRCWPFRIRCVTLNPDGTVVGSYVKLWKYYEAGKNKAV